MGQYIWQKKGWPNLTWQSDELLAPLSIARKAQGQILGKAGFIGLETQAEIIVEEAFTTSEIEGENLNRGAIRSSVARRLGLSQAGLPPEQRSVDGLVEMLMDATRNHSQSLNEKRLFSWHAALFPTGYSGMNKITVGAWRTSTEPMQVISGRIGKEKVHFEALPSKRVPKEMTRFLKWFSNPPADLDGLLRAGIAHFWFVTIHPFDDGNGRIARAITDMALAQDEKTGRRLYSLSNQIVKERDDYYQILEKSQKQDCDVTEWLSWFLGLFARAIESSTSIVDKAIMVAKFWQTHNQSDLLRRQVKVIQKLLEAEPDGWEGGLTNRKYVSLTKVSRETAKRDLVELEKKGIIKRRSGSKGRSTSYALVTPSFD